MARPKKKDKECITKSDIKKAIKEVKEEQRKKRNKCIGEVFSFIGGLIFMLLGIALGVIGLIDFSIFVKGEGFRYLFGIVGYWTTLVGLFVISEALLDDEDEGKKKVTRPGGVGY